LFSGRNTAATPVIATAACATACAAVTGLGRGFFDALDDVENGCSYG